MEHKERLGYFQSLYHSQILSGLIIRVTRARLVHQVPQAHPDPLDQGVLLGTRGRMAPGVPLENK